MEIPPATLATLTVVCCVSHPEWAQVEEQKRLATHTHATPRPARKPRRFLVLAASEWVYANIALRTAGRAIMHILPGPVTGHC